MISFNESRSDLVQSKFFGNKSPAKFSLVIFEISKHLSNFLVAIELIFSVFELQIELFFLEDVPN